MSVATAYQGTLQRPAPPLPAGWVLADFSDAIARERAGEIASSLSVVESGGTLGDGDEPLPPWHYRDELTESGLYRFFTFEHPNGASVGAARFAGYAGTLGAGDPSLGSGVTPSAPSDGSTPTDTSGAGATQPGVSDTSPGGTGAGTATPQQMGQGGTGTAGTGTTTPVSTGSSTSEPVPAVTASCGGWTASTSDASIVTMANNIVNGSGPTAWADQAQYQTTGSDGTAWVLVMWWENGSKMVAAYKCTTPGTGSTSAQPAAASSSGLTAGAIIAGVLVVGGLVWAGLSA
jgi:hypothetical protein